MRNDTRNHKLWVERRKHRRAAVELEAVFQSETGESVRLSVENFSAGGFFCRISRPIEPLTRLGTTFEFPPYGDVAPRTIEATAIVVRCDEPAEGKEGHRLAACFIDLKPRDRDHIEEYVEWYRSVYEDESASEGAGTA